MSYKRYLRFVGTENGEVGQVGQLEKNVNNFSVIFHDVQILQNIRDQKVIFFVGHCFCYYCFVIIYY